MNKRMQALAYDPGGNRFTIELQPVPAPGEYDVLVRVLACGLNPVDSKIHHWNTVAPGMNLHWVTGLDVSGEIVALGAKVEGWQPGDRVLYHGDMFRPHGGFAEFALHDSRTLSRHPRVTPAVAAATPCAGWTAWRALVDKLRLTARDSLFIAGGAGGVGGFAIQIARHLGLETVITTCSAANADYVAALGATHVVDYQKEDVPETILRITQGQGVSRALDTVGGDIDIQAASVLGFEGELVEIVRVARPERYPDPFSKGLSFHQFSLGSGHRHGKAGRETLLRAATAMNDLLEQGKIRVEALTEIELSQVGEALLTMRQQRTRGKIVMTGSA